MAERKILTGITADAFTSDADRWALDKLKRVPLLPQVIQKFYELGLDRWMYCQNMAMTVRCGPRQYSTLYGILQDSCRVLDMPEPELYVASDPYPNAFAGGVERPYITIRSGIINNLTDEQLYYLIGHELGHIKANHILYFSVASVLMPLLDALGRRTFGASDIATQALIMAMYEWSRQAEITSDRAGLLVAQNLDTTLSSLLSMAAGPNRFANEQSVEAFMDQARTYQDAEPLDQIGKMLLFLLMGQYYTHPMPVHRAQMLEKWYLSGAYDLIMEGKYEGAPKAEAGV